MPVAIQTLSWGRRPNVERMLDEIRGAGYDGIELGQIPSTLPPPAALHELLADRGLELIGVSCGSLDEKIRFVEEYRRAEMAGRLAGRRPWRKGPPPYVYVDDKDPPRAAKALADGHRLALHPHMFKPFQTRRDIESCLNDPRYKGILFLPDTAHLTVAGEDVVEVVHEFYDHVVAIHLKDWTDEWGRAYAFYSRGFTELGRGSVRLGEVASYLKRRGYNKWLVVEQDFSADPRGSAQISRQWLRKHLR